MVTQSQFIEDYFNRYEPTNLGPFISVIRGVSYKPADIKESAEDGVTILRSNNISDGEINYDDLVFVSDSCVSQKQYLQSGDIVMCGSNGSKKLVGKAGLITNEHGNTSFGAFCLGIRCNDNLSPEYLNAYFNSDMYRSIIEELGNGTNIINIRPDHITSLAIPIPDMEAQKRFVSMSRQADKSKFGGLKSQFIEETKLWENEGTIRDLIHNTVEKAGKKYSADSKIRYIDISSVDNETNTVTGVTEYIFKDAPSRAQQCVKKGDILVSTVRPNLKNIAVNHLDGEDLVASSGFCVLRPKEGCAGLIMAYILSDVFTEKMTLVAKGTNYPAIHDSDILDYKIRLPEDSKVSMIDRLFRQADKSKYMS